MAHASTQVLIETGVANADDEELDAATARLREELLELDVGNVTRPSAGPAPPGTRAGELAAIGALLVGIVQTPDVLRALVDRVLAWLDRGRGRSVKLTLSGDTIEITGSSKEEQRQLIAAWLARHGGASVAESQSRDDETGTRA